MQLSLVACRLQLSMCLAHVTPLSIALQRSQIYDEPISVLKERAWCSSTPCCQVFARRVRDTPGICLQRSKEMRLFEKDIAVSRASHKKRHLCVGQLCRPHALRTIGILRTYGGRTQIWSFTSRIQGTSEGCMFVLYISPTSRSCHLRFRQRSRFCVCPSTLVCCALA
jgi:hypothetical protein